MEIMLLIMAAAYAVGSKNNKDTNTAAYKAGKEPPGLSKARMRHESGGGRFVTRPGKNSSKSKPKGPGATRLLLAQRWAHGCEKARTKGEDKMRRWRAWYQEQAPQRDEAWRAKQRQKMANRAARLEKWQGRWTIAKNAAGAAADTMTGRGRGEQDTTGQNTSGDAPDPADETTSQTTDPPAEPATGEEPPNQPGLEDQAGQSSENTQTTEKNEETGENTDSVGTSDNTTEGASRSEEPEQSEGSEEDTGSSDSGAGSGTATQSSTTPIGELVDYQQGAATLHNHADEVAGYDTALTGLGQDMESVNWGAEVHGELTEMHSKLGDIAARYRDLAESVKHQGDAVNDAYDAAPWAPDRSVLTQ